MALTTTSAPSKFSGSPARPTSTPTRCVNSLRTTFPPNKSTPLDGAVTFTEEELEEAAEERGTRLDDHLSDFMSRLYQAGKRGFLFEAATPTPQMFGADGGVTTYGFGWYQKKWFYTEALDEAFVQRLFDWKESFYEECRKKDAAKNVKEVTTP